jgi:2-C-methyl-D-erythritol 4-phosphate cytidylyltransferase
MRQSGDTDVPLKKEYMFLGNGCLDDEGRPLTVLGSAVCAFALFPQINVIVITVPPDAESGEAAARASLPARFFRSSGAAGGSSSRSAPRVLFVPGGKTRRVSVHHALSLLAAYKPDYVLIHDGARPWVSAGLIERTLEAVVKSRAVIPLLPLTETPKEVDNIPGRVTRHLPRGRAGTAQTPQAFAFPEILTAHEKAAEQELAGGREYTDDAEVWDGCFGPVAVIPGDPANRKITFKEDLASL